MTPRIDFATSDNPMVSMHEYTSVMGEWMHARGLLSSPQSTPLPASITEPFGERESAPFGPPYISCSAERDLCLQSAGRASAGQSGPNQSDYTASAGSQSSRASGRSCKAFRKSSRSCTRLMLLGRTVSMFQWVWGRVIPDVIAAKVNGVRGMVWSETAKK